MHLNLIDGDELQFPHFVVVKLFVLDEDLDSSCVAIEDGDFHRVEVKIDLRLGHIGVCGLVTRAVFLSWDRESFARFCFKSQKNKMYSLRVSMPGLRTPLLEEYSRVSWRM